MRGGNTRTRNTKIVMMEWLNLEGGPTEKQDNRNLNE